MGGVSAMERNSWAEGWRVAQAVGQKVFEAVIVTTALALAALILAQALGWMPWPDLALTWGGVPVAGAGPWVEGALAALALALVFFLPASRRIARLEASHRSFAMGIEDVARAYRLAHEADRREAFALSGEFDAVRARMTHLRDHPDLRHLEPELLQLAAEMSFQARDLAQVYSEARVARAKGFLRQRQEEVTMLTERLGAARRTCDELRRWLHDVEADERTAQAQIKRLEADLKDLLPTLGYVFDHEEAREDNVVALPSPRGN